jgi:hypothetical protein
VAALRESCRQPIVHVLRYGGLAHKGISNGRPTQIDLYVRRYANAAQKYVFGMSEWTLHGRTA